MEEPAGGPARQGPDKPAQEEEGQSPSRPERREERRSAERRRMAKHGAGLSRVYADAVRKRVAAARKKRRKA